MQQRTLGLLAAGLLAGALVLGGAGVALAQRVPASAGAGGFTTPAVATTTGMMGGSGGTMGGSGTMMGGSSGMMGSMMGGGIGGPVQSASPSDVWAQSAQAAADATVDRQANTVTYHGTQVQIVAVASPDTGPDMTWNVDGLVNPTVVVPQGAAVTVAFYNADAGTWHGWELTTATPPFTAMPMMQGSVAFPGAFAMPVAGATAQSWSGRTLHFSAAEAGTFFYLCPVPKHAEQGMYGEFVVQ